MRCPKCDREMTDDFEFCPYCGKKLSSYEDPFASYRSTTLWESKIEKTNAEKEKIQYVDSPRYTRQTQKDNRFSYLAIFLSILAIPLCFFNWGLGLLLAVIAFVVCSINLKRASNGVKITSLLISIFGGVITTVLSIFLAVSSIRLVLDNGY